MPILESFPASLECSTIVFRTLKPSWLQEGEINSIAFFLREYDEGFETGLSVANNVDNALKVFAKPKAVVSLHVGRIRDVGLEVIPDTEPDPEIDTDKITHAEITGVPPPDTDDNRLIAERFANALIEMTKDRDFAWVRP